MKRLTICLLALFLSLTSYIYAEDDILATNKVIHFGNFKKREVLYRVGGMQGDTYRLWYMTDMNDEPLFCLEKGIDVDEKGEYKLTSYNKDDLYNNSPMYGTYKRTFPNLNDLVKIIDAYKKIGHSYAAYAAVQCMIWEMQGTSTDLSKHALINAKIKEIKDKIKEEEISLKPSFEKITYKPYKTNIIKDKNKVISNKYEVIDKSEGIENIRILQDEILFDITSTSPKDKFIKLSAKNNLNNNIDTNKAKVYLSDGYQTIFAYEGLIDRVLEDVIIEMTYDTGDLKLIKKDEFGNIAKGESSFRIYDLNNKEILNENNTYWTTVNGYLNINNYLAPGVYYIKEIATHDFYKVSDNIAKIEIKANELNTIEFINYHKTYDLNYYKVSDNTKINDARFILYDMEQGNKDVYFIKKNHLIDLNKMLNITCDDIKTDIYEIKNNKLIAYENTYIKLNDIDIYVLNKDLLNEDYIKLSLKEINKIISGEDYIQIDPNTKFEIYDENKIVYDGMSDETGYISLKNYQNMNYYFKYADKYIKYKINNSDGIIHLKNLKADHKYLLCEQEANPKYTMNNSDVCYVIDTSKKLEDIKHKNIHNDLKEIEFKLYKTNGLGNDHLLNNAHYDVYYYLDDCKIELGKFITGALKINTKSYSYYEIYQDNDLIMADKVIDDVTFIPNLKEGEYEIKLYNEQNISKTYKDKVNYGCFVLKDLPYGASLYLLETKAPSSYKRDDKAINIKLELDKYTISAKHFHLNELIVIDTHAW